MEGYVLGGMAALASLYGLWFFEYKKKRAAPPATPQSSSS
jgi:hypothetical protein